MKKTILSTAITLMFSTMSGTVLANDDANWEDLLDEASSDLGNINVEDILESDNFEDFGVTNDIDNIIDEKEENLNLNKNEVADSSEYIETQMEETENFVEDIVEEVEEEPVANEIEEDIVEVESVIPRETVVTNPEDLNFLRYIPEGTRFTINKTFKVLPKKKYIIMHEGERVLKNPQTKLDPEKTFCYIQLKPSGKARILRQGKKFQVTGVRAKQYDTEVTKSYGDYNLRTYKVDFRVDNPSVVSLSCYSAKMFRVGEDEAPVPLLIKDLKEQMGKIIKIDYAAYEEI